MKYKINTVHNNRSKRKPHYGIMQFTACIKMLVNMYVASALVLAKGRIIKNMSNCVGSEQPVTLITIIITIVQCTP